MTGKAPNMITQITKFEIANVGSGTSYDRADPDFSWADTLQHQFNDDPLLSFSPLATVGGVHLVTPPAERSRR